jgi:hypothetical protein
LDTSSFEKMELRWVFTVLGLMLRLAAISAFVLPAVRNAKTSFSREVRRPGLLLMVFHPEATSPEATSVVA